MNEIIDILQDDETNEIINEQTYALVDIIHNKIINKVFMENLINFFYTDEIRINAAIDNSEVIGDRFMICKAEIISYPKSLKKEIHASKRIDVPKLNNTEKRISYIYRHLYKYGNTITSFNPGHYRDKVKSLGLDFTFIKKLDESKKKNYYILTKKDMDV